MSSSNDIVAVRLEGGLGDHLLGMRLLRFIRLRYPNQRIVVFSDAEGAQAQLDIASMSPHVAEVRVLRRDPLRMTEENLGSLSNLTPDSLSALHAAGEFFDAFTGGHFVQEARRLGISHYEVLSSLPDIVIPEADMVAARAILPLLQFQRFVGLNLTKYGPGAVRSNLGLIKTFLGELLTDPDVAVLHFYTRSYDFPHAPEPPRSYRQRICAAEAAEVEALSAMYPGRVISIVDQPIGVVSALLSQCFYFVGVDNGIKHLAWALNVPRSWLSPGGLVKDFIMRWAPDYWCMIEVQPWSVKEEIGRTLATNARIALSQSLTGNHNAVWIGKGPEVSLDEGAARC